MAVTEIVPNMDIGGTVMPLANRISSEPLLLAAIVIITTAMLAVLCLWFFYKLTANRDESFRILTTSFNSLLTTLTKSVQIQESDHEVTVRNGDMLQKLALAMESIKTQINQVCREIKKPSTGSYSNIQSSKEEGHD